MIECELQEAVLTLRFNRPDALNALRPEMLEALSLLIKQADDDAAVSVIVLTGAGRAFSAGVDLKVLQGIDPVAGKIGDVFDAPAQLVAAAMRGTGKPVIARVHGACFTGALEIALHCDFIYTTEDTKFGDTHTKFGLRPTWGMSQTLARAVGLRRAKELSFTARTFSGAEAAAWGLANAAYPSLEALDEALAETTRRIAGNSQGAVAAMKDLYSIAEDELGVLAGLDAEAEMVYPQITDTNERLAGF
jgi:enoyl-CoA hydratase/carnithine racemase